MPEFNDNDLLPFPASPRPAILKLFDIGPSGIAQRRREAVQAGGHLLMYAAGQAFPESVATPVLKLSSPFSHDEWWKIIQQMAHDDAGETNAAPDGAQALSIGDVFGRIDKATWKKIAQGVLDFIFAGG